MADFRAEAEAFFALWAKNRPTVPWIPVFGEPPPEPGDHTLDTPHVVPWERPEPIEQVAVNLDGADENNPPGADASPVADAQQATHQPTRESAQRSASALAARVLDPLGQSECGLCRKIYNERTPVEPCEHSFCRSCIVEHIAAQTRRKVPVDCPMCGRRIEIVKLDMEANALIEGVVEAVGVTRTGREVSDRRMEPTEAGEDFNRSSEQRLQDRQRRRRERAEEPTHNGALKRRREAERAQHQLENAELQLETAELQRQLGNVRRELRLERSLRQPAETDSRPLVAQNRDARRLSSRHHRLTAVSRTVDVDGRAGEGSGSAHAPVDGYTSTVSTPPQNIFSGVEIVEIDS